MEVQKCFQNRCTQSLPQEIGEDFRKVRIASSKKVHERILMKNTYDYKICSKENKKVKIEEIVANSILMEKKNEKYDKTTHIPIALVLTQHLSLEKVFCGGWGRN